MATQSPQENTNINREQFRQNTGVDIPPEKWQPLKPDAKEKLAILRQDIETTREADQKMEKALAFIEANKVTPVDYMASTMATAAVNSGTVDASQKRQLESDIKAPVVVGTAGTVLSESLGDAAKDIKKTLVKDLGFIGLLFVNPKDLDPKDVAEQAKSFLEKKKNGGFFEKFFSSLQLHFLLRKTKQGGINLSEHLSEEEMKSLGLKKVEGTSTQSSSVREGQEETRNTALIIASYKGFARIFARPEIVSGSKEKIFAQPDIDRLITFQAFRDLRYTDLISFHQKYKNNPDKSGLKRDLKIADLHISGDLIFFVMNRMAEGRGKEYIEKHALPGQDIEKMQVGDIFSRLHKHVHLGGSFDSIKPSKPITGPTEFMEYLGEVGKKIDLPLDSTESIFSNLEYKEKIESLGISASMAGYILANKSSNINSISPQTIKESTISDNEGKEGMEKLLSFWEKFQTTIIQKFSFGNPEKYKEFLSKNGVELGDIFRLYLVTGGNPSFEDMNGTQEAYIYMKLWNILGKDPSFRGEYFNKPLINALFEEGSKIQISPDAKAILNNMFSNVLDSTINTIGGFTSEVWSSLTTEQKVIFTTVLGGGIVLLWYMKPLKWIGMGVSATVIAGAIGVAIAAMWPNQNKITINGKEYTPEQLKEKMSKEIAS